jgi:hypothetical protein
MELTMDKQIEIDMPENKYETKTKTCECRLNSIVILRRALDPRWWVGKCPSCHKQHGIKEEVKGERPIQRHP